MLLFEFLHLPPVAAIMVEVVVVVVVKVEVGRIFHFFNIRNLESVKVIIHTIKGFEP